MGLRSPFGYYGYETTFVKTYIYLIDHFCSGCHTEDHTYGGCKDGCPAGVLINECKVQILQRAKWAREDTILFDKKMKKSQKDKTMIKIGKEIKKIEQHPLFNSNFIFQDKLIPDALENLRKLAKDLEFEDEISCLDFSLQNDLLEEMRKVLKKKTRKKKVKK